MILLYSTVVQGERRFLKFCDGSFLGWVPVQKSNTKKKQQPQNKTESRSSSSQTEEANTLAHCTQPVMVIMAQGHKEEIN